MNEYEFLDQLKERATQQEKLMRAMLMPKLFLAVCLWLGNHPWRIVIPVSIILTLIFEGILGKRYSELILKIFGKL